MADVSVRAAQPQDAERVARVQRSTWRQAYRELLPPDVLDTPEVELAAIWLHAVQAPPSPRHRLFVALERDELVGFAASAPEDDVVELTALLVEPRWGRRGHGSRLLAATVDAWRQDGASVATSWVWERDTPSRDLLSAAGWVVDGNARGLDVGPRVERQLRMHVDVRE